MTEQIDLSRRATQLQQPNQDDLLQHQGRKKVASGEAAKDRVTLDNSSQVEETYGPQAELNIGSNYELLRSLVVKTLQEQNVLLQVSTTGSEIDLSNLSVEEAKQLVAEDGYFGVEKTSQRIVDFALNAYGKDPAKLEAMKSAIDKGFQDAQQAFGGSLPEISQQTYDAIMEKLDAFAEISDKSGE